MGKAYFRAPMDHRHDGLCKRMAEIGNSVGWTCVLEADADFRGGMAAHHARALRQAEKDFEEASKSGRLGEAEGAARRGITAAGGVRETRDGKGIRPDLLVREGQGGDKGGGGKEKRLGEVRGLLEAKSMAFCASNYGDKTTWGKRGDGKTWAERVADRCVRARMREVSALDEQFFAGVTPAPVAARVAALGGIRGVVLGGFNEHSAEVHCFVERAAAAGAAKVAATAGLDFDDARAALRKRFRQKLAVGAWRDLHTHLLARLPYVNPTPAAEAKLLAQRAEFDRLWMEKRMAVQQRRLGEGEALAARARAGRGAAAGTGGNVGGGTAAASQATAFLEEVLGAGRGAAGDGEARTDDRGAGAPTAGGDDALNEEGEEAPAMTAASDSECEASASARQIGRVAGGERGQTNEGAPGDGAPTSGR